MSNDYFNSIYDKIINTYKNGLVSNGDEFLDYLESKEEVDNLLTYLNTLRANDYHLTASLNYQQKYFGEIFYNSIVDAYDNGLISNYEDFLEYISNREDISNFYVMTLAVIADSIEDVYYDISSVYASNKIEYAIGDDLDSIGEIVGCPRPQATRSSVMVTFKLGTVSDTTIPIVKGTVVSSITGINFVTVEDAFIPSGQDSVDVCCMSVGTGTDTRVLSKTINKIDDTFDASSVGGVTVYNSKSSSGGRNAYSDEEYRALLLEWVQSNIKGSREAYHKYFSTFEGIDGYKLIPNWNGSGTLKIVIDPGYPYQLQLAYDEITATVCQIDDDITMWSPTPVPVDVYCSCNVDIDQVNPFSDSEKEEIKSKIEDVIRIFIDGDTFNSSGLGIGEDFVPYQLGVFISKYVPEVKNITFYQSEDKFCKYLEGTSDEVVQLLLASPVTISDEEIGYCNSVVVNME